jgi:hypothetical protein
MQKYHPTRIITLTYQPFVLARTAIFTYHEAKVNADRVFSKPWPHLRVHGYNGRMQRCNSNASAWSSFSSNNGGLGSSRRSYKDAHGKRRREECAALERYRSARHSPGNNADNGLLRFYLTPIRSASIRWTGVLSVKGGRQLRSQSFARTMLGLY